MLLQRSPDIKDVSVVQLPVMLTVAEVADRLNVGEPYVRIRIRGSVIGSFRLGPRHTTYRLSPEHLDCFVAPQLTTFDLPRPDGSLVDERLFTVDEVAEYLRIHPQTVYEWVWSGELPHRRLGPTGRSVRLTERDVVEYLEACHYPARF